MGNNHRMECIPMSEPLITEIKTRSYVYRQHRTPVEAKLRTDGPHQCYSNLFQILAS